MSIVCANHHKNPTSHLHRNFETLEPWVEGTMRARTFPLPTPPNYTEVCCSLFIISPDNTFWLKTNKKQWKQWETGSFVHGAASPFGSENQLPAKMWCRACSLLLPWKHLLKPYHVVVMTTNVFHGFGEKSPHITQIFLSWSTHLGWIFFQLLICRHFIEALKAVKLQQTASEANKPWEEPSN